MSYLDILFILTSNLLIGSIWTMLIMNKIVSYAEKRAKDEKEEYSIVSKSVLFNIVFWNIAVIFLIIKYLLSLVKIDICKIKEKK